LVCARLVRDQCQRLAERGERTATFLAEITGSQCLLPGRVEGGYALGQVDLREEGEDRGVARIDRAHDRGQLQRALQRDVVFIRLRQRRLARLQQLAQGAAQTCFGEPAVFGQGRQRQ